MTIPKLTFDRHRGSLLSAILYRRYPWLCPITDRGCQKAQGISFPTVRKVEADETQLVTPPSFIWIHITHHLPLLLMWALIRRLPRHWWKVYLSVVFSRDTHLRNELEHHGRGHCSCTLAVARDHVLGKSCRIRSASQLI